MLWLCCAPPASLIGQPHADRPPRITLRSQSKLPTCRLSPLPADYIVKSEKGAMCLVKVKQEEDHVVPYRVVQRARSPPRRRVSRHSRDIERRYSRSEVVRDSPPRPSSSYIAVPSPKPLQIPAPQPVPVFIQPSPPPPPPPAPMPAPRPPPSHISSHHTSHHGGAHYVEVSPRSSITSHTSSLDDRSEYVYREREVRREHQRAYSPDNPRYEHYRYVEPESSESDQYERYQTRDRSRQRSRSRAGYDDSRGGYRETTNMRVSIGENDGRRRRDYGR